MSKLDKDQVIDNFVAAYTAANGKAPTIEAKGGWYSIDGGKNVRLAQVEEMSLSLSGTKKASNAATPKAEKAIPAAKSSVSKQAVKTAVAKPKKKTVKKGDFSVKGFYTAKIQDANSGAKAPR